MKKVCGPDVRAGRRARGQSWWWVRDAGTLDAGDVWA